MLTTVSRPGSFKFFSHRHSGLSMASLSCATDSKTPAGAAAVEAIADAVTHARFVGTDPESDEVVLMKILYVCSPEIVYCVSCKNVFILSFMLAYM